MKLKEELDKMEKKQKRLIAFFDAVFAIAITMMSLQITLPEVPIVRLIDLEPVFEDISVYFISFFALGGIWMIHTEFFAEYKYLRGRFMLYLHLLLMFLVTLFPFITRLMNTYPQNIVRVLYLAIFLFMEILILIIIILMKKENSMLKVQRKNFTEKIIMDSDIIKGKIKRKEVSRIMQIIEACSNDNELEEEMMHGTIDAMPENIGKMLEEIQKQQTINFRYSLFSMGIMLITIFLSVISLMIHPFLCYVPLIIGGIVNSLCKLGIEMKKKK